METNRFVSRCKTGYWTLYFEFVVSIMLLSSNVGNIATPTNGGSRNNQLPVRIAVFQPKDVCSGESATYACQSQFLGDLNVSFQELAENTKGRPIDFVVFQEMFLSTPDPSAQSATFDVLQYQAKRFSSYFIVPVLELDRDGALYNTVALLDRAGQLVGKYRKIHLSRTEMARNFSFGDRVVVFQTDVGRISILVCNDVYFPETWQAASDNVDIIFWPSAFDGAGFLSAYARLFSVFIIPAAPHSVRLEPADVTGGRAGVGEGLIRRSSFPGGELFEAHLGSRIVCNANRQLLQLIKPFQANRSLLVRSLEHELWDYCYLLQPAWDVADPALDVPRLLAQAGIEDRGLPGWRHALRDEEARRRHAHRLGGAPLAATAAGRPGAAPLAAAASLA